jgi:hypothetical protein
MSDLAVLGTGCLIGGGALVALFVYLRSHAEKFRNDSRENHAAIRSRLANDFFLEYLTKSIQQIDDILKRSPEFAGIRSRFIKAITKSEGTSEVIEEIKSAIEKVPPTLDESNRLKELTGGLLNRFEESEKVSKFYNVGWSAEEKCSTFVLTMIASLFGLGFLVLWYSVAPKGFETSALLMGGLLTLILAMSTMNAIERFRDARIAQLEFNKVVDKELYSFPPFGAK